MKLPKFEAAHVLTLGDAMLDRYWHGDTRRVSAEAPIPIVDVGRMEDRPGGAANVALNVASLGAQASLIAAVGKDEAAEALRAKLTASGIALHLIEAPASPTITKVRLVSRNQQMLRADFEAPFALPPGELKAALAAQPDYGALILSDYDKGTLASPKELVKAAAKQGRPCLVDPKFKPLADYAGATLVKPNKLELETALGAWRTEEEMLRLCRQAMASHGIGAMLVTRASDGMTLVTPDDDAQHFPAIAREVYDTSGAGDTVIATLAAALAAGATLKDAVALANIAAGLVVSHFGVASVSAPELRLALPAGPSAGRGQMTQEQLQAAIEAARAKGETIVFTNGCFDILHAGHVDYLEEARQAGDRLVVAVNDDASVRRLKGEGRPINRLEHRMAMLAGLAAVDWVAPFSEDTPEALLKALKPDLLVKGGDYAESEVVGAELVRAYGGKVRVLALTEGCSTTGLVQRLRDLP